MDTIPSSTQFDFRSPTRVIFQAGGLDLLGELVAEYGGRRALIVTDSGIVAAGYVSRAVESLQKRDVDVVIFDQVKENPTDTVVSDCATLAKDAQVDFLVGLGGGSSMDTAKGCNFVLTNGGTIADYWGVGKASQPMLPLIAVPTTTGTGSECQSFALISDSTTHVKMACGDPKAAARVALLDPVLTQSQPRTVKICTGIDAISHAVESAVCNRRSSMSDIFSHGAFEYCASSFPGVVAETHDLLALGRMQVGAAWAGSAIELSMLGAAHAMANPLTKRFGLIHGLAVGLMLPTVVRFNAADTNSEAVYRALLLRAGLPTHAPSQSSAGETLADWLERTFDQSGLQELLGPLLIPEHDLEELAEEASQQWTGTFNPRQVNADEFRQLYRSALLRHGRLSSASTEGEQQPCEVRQICRSSEAEPGVKTPQRTKQSLNARHSE